MNIVLTNDDGIDSLGLKKLESVLSKYGNVYVVAPSVQQSGKACSISAFFGITMNKIDNNHLSVDGTPVDCVEVACAMIDKKIDLVVSGCNSGYNLSQDVMYSGTCGACVQASLSKLPSIAFSVKSKDHFEQIDKYAKEVLDYIFENNLLDSSYFLNVNIPSEEAKGIKLTKIYEPIYESYYEILIDSKTNKYIIERKPINQISNEDCDKVAVNNGYISITPLSQNLFKENIYKKVKAKLEK